MRDASATRDDFELFEERLWDGALFNAGIAERGVCFNPDCRKRFNPSRSWQMYCCTRCQVQGRQEFEKWGRRFAPALFCWNAGRHTKDESARKDVAREARRFLSRAATDWRKDREARAARADAQREAS